MKRAFAAFIIASVSLAVLFVHAWYTWDAAEALTGASYSDLEFFRYSLFLESFVFMASAAYFVGPKIYRLFREEDAAKKFEGEEGRLSRSVHVYAAVCVIIRRIILDPKLGVSFAETAVAIALISIPPTWSFIRARVQRARKSPNQPRQTTPFRRG